MSGLFRRLAVIWTVGGFFGAWVRVQFSTGHRVNDWRVLAVFALMVLAGLSFAVLSLGADRRRDVRDDGPTHEQIDASRAQVGLPPLYAHESGDRDA